MSHHVQPRDRGVAIVLVASLLVGLLVMAAIVIDLGNARQTKRDAQNDVDAAALAGAAVYDGSTAGATAARSRAVEFLDANERSSTGPANADTRSCGGGDTCTITFDFTPAPAASPPPTNAATRYCMRIRILDLEIDTYFANVMGVYHTDVSATANGCKRFTGGSATSNIPAALSLGTCSNAYEAFETSGNDNRFIGDIHSNGSARDTGTNNLRSAGAAATTRIAIASASDQDQLWNGYTTIGTDEEDPVTPGALTPQQLVAQYAPGGTRATEADALGLYTSSTNDMDFSGNIPAGIYYTTKKITVGGTGVTVTPRNGHTGVILVATGDQVIISGNGARLTPFSLNNPNRLTVIAGWDSSGNTCSDTGFNMSGECARVDGIMYVPFTKATFSNNGNGHDDNGRGGASCDDTPTYTGALVAYSMKLDGNQHLLRGGVGSTGLTPEVFLDA